MGGIGGAVDAHLPIIAPGWLARGRMMQRRQFVDIFTLCIISFTKKTRLYHRLDQDNRLAIDHIFCHHINRRTAFACGDQPATFVERDGGGHFTENMDITLQGRDRLRHMIVHGGRHDDNVWLHFVQHFFVIGIEAGDVGRFTNLQQGGLMQITQGDDLRGRVVLEGLEKGTGSACTGKGYFEFFSHFSPYENHKSLTQSCEGAKAQEKLLDNTPCFWHPLFRKSEWKALGLVQGMCYTLSDSLIY